jgi:hypothetical protein
MRSESLRSRESETSARASSNRPPSPPATGEIVFLSIALFTEAVVTVPRALIAETIDVIAVLGGPRIGTEACRARRREGPRPERRVHPHPEDRAGERKSGSHRTRWWRKWDTNHRSLSGVVADPSRWRGNRRRTSERPFLYSGTDGSNPVPSTGESGELRIWDQPDRTEKFYTEVRDTAPPVRNR